MGCQRLEGRTPIGTRAEDMLRTVKLARHRGNPGASHVMSTLHARLSPSARAQAMVATSHTPVMVWTALSARSTMGTNMRWKTSHRAASPSTVLDCRKHMRAASAHAPQEDDTARRYTKDCQEWAPHMQEILDLNLATCLLYSNQSTSVLQAITVV